MHQCLSWNLCSKWSLEVGSHWFFFLCKVKLHNFVFGTFVTLKLLVRRRRIFGRCFPVQVHTEHKHGSLLNFALWLSWCFEGYQHLWPHHCTHVCTCPASVECFSAWMGHLWKTVTRKLRCFRRWRKQRVGRKKAARLQWSWSRALCVKRTPPDIILESCHVKHAK